jgi:hypothetical protein
VHIHWILPLIAQVFVGFALNEYLYTLSGYLADSYTIYAASGFAGMVLVRALTCAVLVPFTKPMYVNLGYNTATSVLAGIATVFCVALIVFMKYGRRIREASRFAKVSLSTYDKIRLRTTLTGFEWVWKSTPSGAFLNHRRAIASSLPLRSKTAMNDRHKRCPSWSQSTPASCKESNDHHQASNLTTLEGTPRRSSKGFVGHLPCPIIQLTP